MRDQLHALQGSVTGKVLFIGALTLLLLIPLGMIRGLIEERTQLYETARIDIANSCTGNVDADERRRGIYRVPVYTTNLAVTGRFPAVTLGSEYPEVKILWEQAQIALPLTDARSVTEPIVLASGNGTTTFEASGGRVAGFGPQLVAPYAALGLGALTAPQAFSFELVLGGTGALHFLPLGDETRVAITSDWPSPSFAGAFLPTDRTVGASGFTAEWRVLDLGRGYPSSWKRSDAPQAVAATAFGAELITPVGIHEATTLRRL